jgi:molybdopterin/thiamine biosynthesis adenylyltransferase
VVGALTGVVGSMMALEAIKWIARSGESLLGRLMIYDGLAGAAHVARVAADPACPVCGPAA